MKRIFYILFTTLLLSCSSNSDNPEENIPELDTSIRLVSSTYANDVNSNILRTTYVYDNEGKLIKKTTNDGDETSIDNFIYTEGKISEIEYSNGDYHNFYYSNGKITSSRLLDYGELYNYKYTYDSKQRLIKRENDKGSTTVYSYSGDNIISIKEGNNTTTMTYDNKYNPDYIIYAKTGLPFAISKNNPTTRRYNTQLINYTYIYNEHNMPISKKADDSSKTVETFTYSK